jgi:hypothetical protein
VASACVRAAVLAFETVLGTSGVIFTTSERAARASIAALSALTATPGTALETSKSFVASSSWAFAVPTTDDAVLATADRRALAASFFCVAEPLVAADASAAPPPESWTKTEWRPASEAARDPPSFVPGATSWKEVTGAGVARVSPSAADAVAAPTPAMPMPPTDATRVAATAATTLVPCPRRARLVLCAMRCPSSCGCGGQGGEAVPEVAEAIVAVRPPDPTRVDLAVLRRHATSRATG